MAFGKFDDICSKAAFPLCSVVGTGSKDFSRGILPECYARPVELANTMIFQIGNAFVQFGGLGVLLMIIFNIRQKYTAIGRKEMLHFTYLFIGLIVSTLVVDCGVSPPSSTSYSYFVSIQLGLASATCISLLYNGFVCFQFWEDGSKKSMWLLRIISLIWFIINFFVSISSFKNWGSNNNRDTLAIFIVTYIVNAIILATYVVSQVILVFFALDSNWPLGAISLAVFFFVAGQVLVYVFNLQICKGTSHYIDGLFFGSLCNIFAVMMIYKFWDMITTDDLEFSVATAENGINTLGMEDEKRNSIFFN